MKAYFISSTISVLSAKTTTVNSMKSKEENLSRRSCWCKSINLFEVWKPLIKCNLVKQSWPKWSTDFRLQSFQSKWFFFQTPYHIRSEEMVVTRSRWCPVNHCSNMSIKGIFLEPLNMKRAAGRQKIHGDNIRKRDRTPSDGICSRN